MDKGDNGGESKPMEEDETEASGASREERNVNLFSQYFPKSFGKALEEAWPVVKSTLEPFAAVSCTLNMVEGTMTLSATEKASSQRFFRAKFVITILAIGVPKDKALKSLSGRPSIFVIGTQEGGLCSQFQIAEKKYKKRLKRLLGSPLEADYIFAAGPVEGLNLAKKIVTDCIVHGVRPTSQIRRTKRMNRVIDDLGALRF